MDVEFQAQPAISFNQQAAAIAKKKAIAKALLDGSQQIDPNQIVSGRVVPLSPIAAAAPAINHIMGAILSDKAGKSEAALQDAKLSKIAELLKNPEQSPDYAQVAEIMGPEAGLNMYASNLTHQRAHADKLEELKTNKELALKQAELQNQWRIEEAARNDARDHANRMEMAHLTASLAAANRPAPQPRQDPLVQVAGPDGQPIYLPSSQAVGKQPFTAQTLKQEQAAAAKEQQINQNTLSAQQALDQAAMLNAHPGKKWGTGASSFVSSVPGTDARGFKANLDTFKAQTFVPMVSALKGMGALSDAEGKKLSESVGALDPGMKTEEFDKSLKDITNYLYQKGKAAGLNVQLPDFAVETQQPTQTSNVIRFDSSGKRI